jgi:3-oxoacyl-[acyl-carrier protein] reductase
MGAPGMRAALITGGSAGIGAAIARKLASQGIAVAVTYRSGKAKAEALVAEITAQGGQAACFGGDVSIPADAQALADAVAAKFGNIDILVNNAGIIEAAVIGSIDPASFERQFSSNVLSVLLMMQATLPYFPESGGRVINISSSLATNPAPSTAIYSASKAAVNTLTHCFAKELGAKNITVNAIAPGATETDMTSAIDPAIKNQISASTPLGRWAKPQDIADVAAFLASDDARFITGRVIVVDGGLA